MPVDMYLYLVLVLAEKARIDRTINSSELRVYFIVIILLKGIFYVKDNHSYRVKKKRLF